MAAASLPPEKGCNLAVRNPDLVKGKMTPDQVAEARRLGWAASGCRNDLSVGPGGGADEIGPIPDKLA